MSNSIFNNDDITYSNGVRNPMIKNLACNKYDIQDVGKLTCNEMEIDQSIILAGGLSVAGTLSVGGGLHLTGGDLDATGVNGNFHDVNAGNNVNAGGVLNGGSMVLTTTAQIGTNCNVGENIVVNLQGGTPSHNICGLYGVNNVPALETYFQSAENVGQHGVAILRSSNGGVSGVVNSVICDASQGIALTCDNGSILLDTGGVGMVDLDNTERIINCVNPVDPQDVATKDYVDNEIEAAHGNFDIDQPLILGQNGSGNWSIFYSVGINAILDVETITYRTYDIHLNTGVGAPMTISQGDTNGNPIGGANQFLYGGAYVSFVTISAGELWRFTPSKQTASPTRLYFLVEKVF